MDFEKFIEEKKVIRCQKDVQKVKSLLKMSKNNLEFFKSIDLSKVSATVLLVNYYDSLRQILEAITLLEGYKVLSHEAYTYYLKKINENSIAEKFDRFRKLRNGANYYGKEVDIDVSENAIKEISKIILVLKEKYFSQLTHKP